MKKTTLKTKDMLLCAMFTTLTAVGAFIRIPIPLVPFTLQFLFTMLAGLLLGSKLGALSVLTYLLLGLAGLPVFTEGGGIFYIFKPTFGYLIGFLAGTYVTGRIANQVSCPSYKRLLAANFTGLFLVYSFGMIYYWIISTYYLGTGIGLWPLFLYCFLLAVPGDIFLCILAAILGKRLIPVLKNHL